MSNPFTLDPFMTTLSDTFQYNGLRAEVYNELPKKVKRALDALPDAMSISRPVNITSHKLGAVIVLGRFLRKVVTVEDSGLRHRVRRVLRAGAIPTGGVDLYEITPPEYKPIVDIVMSYFPPVDVRLMEGAEDT